MYVQYHVTGDKKSSCDRRSWISEVWWHWLTINSSVLSRINVHVTPCPILCLYCKYFTVWFALTFNILLMLKYLRCSGVDLKQGNLMTPGWNWGQPQQRLFIKCIAQQTQYKVIQPYLISHNGFFFKIPIAEVESTSLFCTSPCCPAGIFPPQKFTST